MPEIFHVEYESAKACGLAKSTIYEIAEEFATSLKLSPGDDLLVAVQKLGGTIRTVSAAELIDTKDGSIKIEPDGKFEIFLADDVVATRNRFTIAHELGHLILHLPQRRAKRNGLIAARYGTGPVEWEANWFAAAFLMPSKTFRKAARECRGNVSSLASRFGVSVESATIRASELQLTN